MLYCAGPLTNIALAIRMDPEIVPLTKAIYIMGGSSAGGPELNWWWDPEAARDRVARSLETNCGDPFRSRRPGMVKRTLMRRAVQAGGPLAGHLKRMYLDFQPPKGTSLWSMMWDELTVASILDPSVIKKSETMYLDVDIDHGPKYGHTVIWKKPDDVPQFFLPYSGPDGPIARSGSPTWPLLRNFIPPVCRWKWT